MFRRGGGSRLINWLALDSWLDSSLYDAWQSIKAAWAAAAAFSQRFRLTGPQKAMSEILSEAATLGTGGFFVLLILAQSSFEAVQRDDWLSPGRISVTFLDGDGNEIGKRGINRSDAVPLAEIPDVVIKATLATEDRRFFEHYGIDVLGTLRALVENLRANEVVQGGSSITQQLAKNLFLSSERSLERKVKEAFLALWLEHHMTKEEILKLYFDRAYMGGGAFGVEAAAQFYFGKSIREVSLAEAAMLAGLFKAPTKYAPHINLAAARARADEVLTNMVQAGFMTEGQVHGARLNPATPIQIGTGQSPDWFLDWAFEEVSRILQGSGESVVFAKTTVDLDLQRVADETVETMLAQVGRARNVKQSALVAMELDGAVRAIVGGRDYGESTFNRATQARRQVGSTFKPYVYLTAMENGFTPYSSMRDTSPFCKPNHYVTNFNGGTSGRSMQLIEALARSTNTIAVKLSHEVGIKKVVEMAKRLGLSAVDDSCTMALGVSDVSPLEHTAVYAVFANGGKSVKPYGVTEITNTRGEVLYSHDRDASPQVQIVERKYIEELVLMLRQVVAGGTARAADLDFTYIGGKTGTTSSFKDAWFMGISGKYVTGMWVGNDDSTPMRGSTGGGVVAPAWRTFMTYALKKVPATEIAALPGLPLHPAQIAEIERLRASRPAEVADTEKKTPSGVMPEASRKALRALAEDLRSAAGIVPEKTGSLEDGGIAKRIGAARRVSSTGGAPL